MTHRLLQNKWARVGVAVFAMLLHAFGTNFFIVPMGLYSSGVLGLSQVIRTLLSRVAELPTTVDLAGIIYLLINIPILLFAWKGLGRSFLLRTVVCIASDSLFLSVLHSPAVPLLTDRLASCVIGGILCGSGLGLALTCGCASGGLDVIGLLLSKRGSRFTVGRFSLSFNAVLYAVCLALFDVSTVIYSVIFMVFSSLFLDRAHQQSIRVQMLIFTKDEDPDLPAQIMQRLGRGVTYWEGHGAYTGDALRVLCVCITKFEEATLREVVHELDPHAFFIIQEGVRIDGNFAQKLS